MQLWLLVVTTVVIESYRTGVAIVATPTSRNVTVIAPVGVVIVVVIIIVIVIVVTAVMVVVCHLAMLSSLFYPLYLGTSGWDVLLSVQRKT